MSGVYLHTQIKYYSFNYSTAEAEVVHEEEIILLNEGDQATVNCNDYGTDFYHVGAYSNTLTCKANGEFEEEIKSPAVIWAACFWE